MLKKSSLILPLFMFLVGCVGGSSTTVDTTFDQSLSYSEDKRINLLNPNRGFYEAEYSLNLSKNYDRFANAKEDGYMLVYAPIHLDDYLTIETLPQTLLDTIEENLQQATQSGLKLILRLSYRANSDGEDPSLSIALGHMEQLKPLLQKYASAIFVIQAGTIGAWGEWHSFTGDFAETNSNYLDNRRAIVEKLVEIFPEHFIQLRTPMHKEQLFGASTYYEDPTTAAEITPDIAFTSDIRAKIGHHNDEFLASDTDMGTYPSDNIEFWKGYVSNDTQYAPLGGEMLEVYDETLIGCTNALKALKEMRYTYLVDTSENAKITQTWKDGGCYDTVEENLGYRLVATSLGYTLGEEGLDFSLSLENRGYAVPYVKTPVRFILSNENYSYRFETQDDIRTFTPQVVQHLNNSVTFSSIEAGEYCLYVQIGEGNNAIRLSNANLWDENTTSNRLLCGIEVE